MHRILAGLVMGMLLWLTGCGSTLAEEDLVKEGQAFEMDKVVDDLQASNFPYEAEYDRKKEFSTLEEVRQEVKDLLGERYWPDVPISKLGLIHTMEPFSVIIRSPSASWHTTTGKLPPLSSYCIVSVSFTQIHGSCPMRQAFLFLTRNRAKSRGYGL